MTGATVRADEGEDADVVTVVVLVVLAALANACALVLLRKAALGEPAAPSFSLRQLWSLLHRPIWAAGMATIFIGFALQATAGPDPRPPPRRPTTPDPTAPRPASEDHPKLGDHRPPGAPSPSPGYSSAS